MRKISMILLAVAFVMFTSIPNTLADVTEGTPLTSSGTSEATIHFTVGDAPTVLDPDDPTNPYEPTAPDDKPTGNTGALTLDYVSSVDFGEHEIAGTTMVYESTALQSFIQVTDRRGTAAGWKVTAQMSAFTNEHEVQTLEGSKLIFANGEAVSPNSGLLEPTPSPIVALETGGDAATVATAPQGHGVASWIIRWFPSLGKETNENVTLEVPAGAASEGNHTATITWTLTDAPGQ